MDKETRPSTAPADGRGRYKFSRNWRRVWACEPIPLQGVLLRLSKIFLHRWSGCARHRGVLSDPARNLRQRKNTMRKIFLALTLLSVSVSSGALAQQQRSGTPEEQRACARDVQRFCRSLMDQGDFTVLACLQQNRTKLTSDCRQVLTNHGQ